MTPLVLAALSCAAWAYLLTARGGFWRAAQRDDAPRATGCESRRWPRVAAVIPARDEADVIGESIASLLRQDYRGVLSVIVVDDHSCDDTGAVSRRAGSGDAARVTVLAAPDLPAGWTGKLWALDYGIRHAESSPEPPGYVLLMDADIALASDTVSELIVRAQDDALVLTSLMAKLNCASLAERALIPAFVFYFQMLYPFAWVNRRQRTTAAAAGGCMLVHGQALRDAGGIEVIRGQLIDDCALARLLKQRGPIWLGLTERAQSKRAYRSFGDIRRMIVRCAFTQLNLSVGWLACTTAAMIVVFVVPPVVALLGEGVARVLAALAWACMALAYQPMLRFYRLSPWRGLALPAIAGCYLMLTLDSAVQHMRGRGGQWKGRTAPEAGTSEVSRSGS